MECINVCEPANPGQGEVIMDRFHEAAGVFLTI